MRETPGAGQNNREGPSSGSNPQRRLERWLREWQIDRVLRDGEEPRRTNATYLRPQPSRRRFVRTLKPGDVRLLYPRDEFTAERPRFVLVVDRAEDSGTVWVAPFSRLASAALPGEWETRLPSPHVAVVCAWNLQQAPVDRVLASWRVTRLLPADLEAVRTLSLNSAYPDSPIWPPASGRVGPPLRDPEDPRWDYVIEEAEAWETWAHAEVVARKKALSLRDEDLSPLGHLPLAAEPGPEYRARPRAGRRGKKGGSGRRPKTS